MKFDSYHPMINLIYFVAAITCTVCFKHPIYLTIGYFCAFVYSVKLGGWKMLLLNLAFLLLAFGYAARYASYEHFGMTVLAINMIDNQITLNRIRKTGDDTYVQMEDDHIASSDMQNKNVTKVGITNLDIYKKVVSNVDEFLKYRGLIKITDNDDIIPTKVICLTLNFLSPFLNAKYKKVIPINNII